MAKENVNRIAKIELRPAAGAALLDENGNVLGGMEVLAGSNLRADLLREIAARWPGLPEATAPTKEPKPAWSRLLTPGWTRGRWWAQFACATPECFNEAYFNQPPSGVGYCGACARKMGAFRPGATLEPITAPAPTEPEPPTEPAFWLVCKPVGVQFSTRDAAVAEARKLAEKMGSDFHIFRAERAVRVKRPAPVIEEIPLGEIE